MLLSGPYGTSRDRPVGTAAAAVFTGLAIAITGCLPAASPGHLAVGRKAPPLELVPLGNSEGPVAAPSFDGKVTLVNFFGTWCPPCRRELPGLVRLAKRLAGESRFQLVAVSCGTGPRDDRDSLRAETRSFLAERGLDLVAWGDPDGRTRFHFAATMDFSAYPTTYLIGPDGVVRRVWAGYRSRDEADMAGAVAELVRSAE